MSTSSQSTPRAAQLRAYLEGFWGTWLLHVGRELKLFQALIEDGPLKELAAARGYEAGYTEVWCRAALAYDFLEADAAGCYRVAPGWAEMLGGTAAWATTYIQVSERVGESLEAVFLGKALPEPSLSLRMLLADGLRASYSWLWNEFAPGVPVLREKLGGARRLIEFGCGCGYGLEHLRNIYPDLELTGIEQDYDCAREAERATRAVIVVGTAEECRYDNRFDVGVFHRALAHCEEPEKAIARAAESLRPQGVLVITSEAEIDAEGQVLRSSSRLRLGERFFYQMFVAEENALRSISMAQIQAWCAESGLETVELATAPEYGSPTLVTRKR